MARVYVGVGSNFDRERNIRSGLRLLEQRFGPLEISPIYDSPPLGGAGVHYFNLVVGFDTEELVDAVYSAMKGIEAAVGRMRTAPARDICAIDLDFLLYNDLVVATEQFILPRPDILRCAFVLRPLADLAPQHRHPQTGTTYLQLWTGMDQPSSVLRDVSYCLQETATRCYGQSES